MQLSAQGCAKAHQEAAEEEGDGGWNYPQVEAAMAKAGFEEIGVCVTRRQNVFAQYIATLLILDLCEWSMWRLGV